MRRNDLAEKRAEIRTMLAATLACYLVGFACVFALSYSLAALAAPGLAANARAAIERQARF